MFEPHPAMRTHTRLTKEISFRDRLVIRAAREGQRHILPTSSIEPQFSNVLWDHLSIHSTMPFSREDKQKAKAAIYNGTNGDEQPSDEKQPIENGHDQHRHDEHHVNVRCCYPKGCILSTDSPTTWENVHFVCNNEQCDKSGVMHGECAEAFEEDILTFLRSVGRARSWSDKQRRQNIWTKKGYDLIYKCCICSCGKGHLRKDLDYQLTNDEETFQQVRSKRKKKKNAEKPALVSPSLTGGVVGNTNNKMAQRKLSNCSQSPPERSPGVKSPNRRTNSKPKDIFTFPSVAEGEQGFYSSSFPWRTDFATMVTILPRQKINPCHIKMDDDAQNDDPRSFILKALFSNSQTSMNCVMCQRNLPVFANYPLLDGTFFLSPRELTTSGCIELELQSKTLYLTAVCMHCLQGNPRAVKCKFCNTTWDGSSHQIGTLYWYDIFAASPCCDRRFECRKCGKPVADPDNSKQYFSDYSRHFECPHCSFVDCHYVKPLALYELADLCINAS